MKIFLSSTYEDLKDIRKTAISFLDDLVGHTTNRSGEVVAMEFFHATESSCKEECLQQLSACDLVVGIYGKRYGSIDSETGLSMTEIEFDYAIEQGIPLLAFVQRNDNRDVQETDFIKNKVFARGLSCANFEGLTDFLDRLNESLHEYLSSYDGYSIDSLWADISDLQAKILDGINNDRGDGSDLQMMPYLADDEDEALSEILQIAQSLEKFETDFSSENNAIFNFAYTADCYPENITEVDKQELVQNVQNCSSTVRRNREYISIGLPNHITRLKLLGMYLKLKRMQHRLATEPWSENLRQEVVATRESYIQTVQSSHCID